MFNQKHTLYELLKSKSVCINFNYPIDAESLGFNIDSPFENHHTRIFNAREAPSPPTLNHEGFCLLSEGLAFNNAYDEKQLNDGAYRIKSILEKYINAKECLLLGHVIRDEASKADQPLINRPPATFVHADWSSERIKNLPTYLDSSILTNRKTTIEKIKKLINHAQHWAIYNVWIPLKTIINLPLALCDTSTIQHSDIIKNVRFKNPYQSDTKIMILSLKYRSSQRWLYYPLMQSNELLVFRQFDSKQGIENFIPVFHTAFKLLNNDNVKTNMRESIEFRFLMSL